MRPITPIFLLLIIISLLVIPPGVKAEAEAPRFEPTECPFPTLSGRTVECGFLVVPEDRAQPAGPTIKLGVAILKSRSPNPQPDPIIFLNGGPGGHALLGFSQFFQAFQSFLGDLNRDVIIFDQRGVGWSQPALECPELRPSLLRQMHGESLTEAEIQAPYIACRDRWMSAGVDLAAYTTAASAADVNDLWRALGYTEVNLYGVSYGTVLAQTVMRDYPNGLRGVILDSAYPLEINLTADSAANMHTGLRQVFAECAADAVCRLVYPDLETTYLDLLETLKHTPAHLTLADPVTAETITTIFDAAALGDTLRLLPAREIPGLIYDLHDGNFTAILQNHREALKAIHTFGAPPGRAMAISVFCSQGLYAQAAVPTHYPEAVWAEHFNADLTPLPCSAWPMPGAPDARAARSDIPTLILSGQFDFTRSPAYDALLTHNLTRSYLVVAPDVGHQVMRSACLTGIAQTFFNQPTVAPNTACVATAYAPILNTRFTVRAAAVRWPALALTALLLIGIGVQLARGILAHRQTVLGLTARSALRGVSALPAVIGFILLGLALWRGGEQFMWTTRARAMETVLVLIATLQAALAFVPEDEPALEVTLATQRPLAWLVLERLTLILVFVGGVGLVLSLFGVQRLDESMWQILLRWFPPLIFFSGLAVCLTLITRRAVFSLAVISLLWFTASALGDLVMKNWPFAWPLNPYLQPDQAEYLLNRGFITVAGLAFGTWGLTLLRDEERLLFGGRSAGPQKKRRTEVEANAGVGAGQPASALAKVHIFLSTFPVAAHQFLAMLWYEFHLQWRRRAISVILLSMLALPLVGAFTLGRQAVMSTATGLDPAQRREVVASQARPAIWGSVWMFLTLLLPVVVAETIPKDKHHGMRELLESFPLSTGVYLAGKLVSVWLVLITGLGLSAVVNGLVWWWVVGPFDWRWYGTLWVAGALPLALMNPSLGVLLAAGQPTQRRALLVGVGLTIVCVILQVPGFLMLNQVWGWINPSRAYLFVYFLVSRTAPDLLTATFLQWLTPEALGWSIIGGLAQTVAVWIGVWIWMRRNTNM